MTNRDRLDEEFQFMLALVRASDPKFFFDREGRPGAVAAIRGALPAVERELLDAVIEDYECEIAATREALFRIVLAKGT